MTDILTDILNDIQAAHADRIIFLDELSFTSKPPMSLKTGSEIISLTPSTIFPTAPFVVPSSQGQSFVKSTKTDCATKQ